jgi:repressor LexA
MSSFFSKKLDFFSLLVYYSFKGGDTMEINNKKILARNLSFYMAEKGIDRSQLCDNLGFRYSTVCEWLSAKKYPRMDKIEILAAYFGVKKSDLIEEHPLTPQKKSATDIQNNTVPVPLIGRVAAGMGCRAEDNIEGYVLTDSEVLKAGYDYFWLTVKGDSMEPELHDGDLVLVREQEAIDSECFAVVRINGEDGVVKRVKIERDRVTLISVNPYYPPRIFEREEMNNITIVGKVIQSKRSFE